MKKIKYLFLAIFALVCVFGVTSCGKKADYTVGILQYATHIALDKATEGFKQEIIDNVPEGKTVKFIVKNPEGDSTTLTTMATQLVRDCDLVMGNATPAAVALKTAAATQGKTNLPILFTSTTDPVAEKLVLNPLAPEGNVTGTSDLNPIEKQMDLIIDFNTETDKIGFIYSASESNSAVQCDTAIAYLKEQLSWTDSQIVVKTVPDQSAISSTVSQLIAEGIDALYIPTDNLLASNMTTVSNVTNPAKIPVYCGESGMVDNGGTMALSINYTALGKTTGTMAAKILFENVGISKIPVGYQTNASDFEFAVNTEALTAMGLTFSETFLQKYNVSK